MTLISEVRLSDQEQSAIVTTTLEIATQCSLVVREISIFGSRADLASKGGDIDIYIQSQQAVPQTFYNFKKTLKLKLYDKLGEQKIDILIDDGTESIKHFRNIILASKVVLWPQKT